MLAPEKIRQIVQRFEFLEAKLSAGAAPDELADLSREYAEIKPIAEEASAYLALLADREAAKEMLSDPEMADLAAEEIAAIDASTPEMAERLQLALIPKDAADVKPAILEIRPGTGGDEAALFASDLWRMYLRFAETRGWTAEILDQSLTELGGVKELTAVIKGKGVFAALKFESGVHRVQRVPETESGGRIHTSAATVAVLPEADDIDIDIPETDIRIDTMRASGAGGQHVNTTDSAVRITHIPTGIVVTSSEKSQHQNRARAMEVLRARLYDDARRKADAERAADRKDQVGSGDRSERIRTYNFPQGRVTDHRINLTLYKLDQVMAGDLGELVAALTAADQAAKLAALDP